MAVYVRFGGVLAHIEDYQWHSEDETLERALNARLDPDGPSGSDHWPDLTAAQEAAERFGGEIVRKTDPPDYKPRNGVVY